jgi:RNA polymerase sigma factor (sigma-70 family)
VVAELTLPNPIPASLVTQAASGDVDALAAIVGAHHDDMARIAYVITRDVDLAQDAVQGAWPVAWRRLGALRDPDRLRPWLMAIAANEARQLVRHRRRRRVIENPITEIGSGRDDPASRDASIDLRRALAQLSPEDRALLGLRYVAGLDAGEIGSTLGLSSSGVRSRLSRLVARLRTELGDA